SKVKYKNKTFNFTCAIFRIHPKTREFELFCQGTSNPWGIAFNPDGEAFASACVIDHLWHLTESGYYIRQGGPYPPFTWPIGSIVDHKHQKAAYCGLHYFDSDAYPAQFRDRLYMGNIHGNCINVDTLDRQGSTYKGKAAPDFLTANDAWFMPVVQKTGPDGCLYILDWYDRYHCYQDAQRDPHGVDRLKGRLYRIRYKDTPRRVSFDLTKENDDQLIDRLANPNIYDRDIAQRLLVERNNAATRAKLETLVLDDARPRKARMHALWTLVSSAPLKPEFHAALLTHKDPVFRAWAVRASGNMEKVDPSIRKTITAMASSADYDRSPEVLIQLAVAARKVQGLDALGVLTDVLDRCGNDPLIPRVVWENLHPLLEDRGDLFVRRIAKINLKAAPNLAALMPRVVDRLLGRRKADPDPIVNLLAALASDRHAKTGIAEQAFEVLTTKVQSGELSGAKLDSLRDGLRPILKSIQISHPGTPLALDAALLAASWEDPAGTKVAHATLASSKSPEPKRLQALGALIAGDNDQVLDAAARVLADRSAGSADFRGRVLAALGRLEHPRVAEVVLAEYASLEPALKPRVIDLLTQRSAWSNALLDAIAAKDLPPEVLNLNQVRKLLQSKDAALVERVKETWGTVREGRNPAREKVVAEMRDYLRVTPGDPYAGQVVFQKLCGQCHKIYGEGQEVGPDLTGVGRSDFDQLVTNIFDPSQVIGSAYQATTVVTRDGRVLTGLLAEDNPKRVVLKVQGGKQEVVPRPDVEVLKTSELSLMPEDVETQLTRAEWADLFSFLELDKP
ncbi:MAG: PVC-type heme-binding CxxCH protein, partial [Isosphaeraceae bacterium]